MTAADKIPTTTWVALTEDVEKALHSLSGEKTYAALAAAIVDSLEGSWVVMRPKSHRALLERVRRAENSVQWAEHGAESARAWARDCLQQERELRDRCTYLYGAARAYGATVEELGGSLQTPAATA